jgi:hypothetical protein
MPIGSPLKNCGRQAMVYVYIESVDGRNGKDN